MEFNMADVEKPAQPVAPVKTVEKVSLKSRLKLMFWKLMTLLLLIALAVTIALWKPWEAHVKAGDRTISVMGSATLKAEPDEFLFSPTYIFTNVDKPTALGEMTARTSEMTAKLKSLGVKDNQIKTNSNNYSSYPPVTTRDDQSYTLYLTVTVGTKELAQKVQDYLLTTQSTGTITPQASFSTAKQKALEDQARTKAETDARAKADQSAKNLGFKINTVKSVDDGSFGNGGCGISYCAVDQGANSDISAKVSQLTIQPGENDLTYSVKVVYYIH